MAAPETGIAMAAELETLGTTPRLASDEIGRRYLRAALDSVLRGGSSLIISGFVPMILARILGPHDFGIYAIITGLTALIAGLLHMGQNSALHKLLPQHYVNDRARGGAILANVLIFTLGFTTVVSLSFMAGASLIAEKLYQNASLTPFFQLCALMILAMTLLNLAASVAAGVQDFQGYNSAMLVRSVLLLGLACMGAMWWGLKGALASQLIAALVGFFWVLRRVIRAAQARFPQLIRPDFSIAIWQTIIGFMLPAFVIALLNAPCYWWANTMVARSQGFLQAGLFSAAYGLAQLISLAPFNFYVPALTFLTEAHASADWEKFNALVTRSLRGIWFVTLPIALGCALFSGVLIEIFYGGKYRAAVPAAFLMSLTGLLMAIVGLLNAILTAAGRIWQSCAITFFWAIIFVGSGWLTIPRWGALGAAAAFGISYLFYFLLLCGYLQFSLRVSLHSMRRLALLTLGSYAAAAGLFALVSGAASFAGGLLLLALVALAGIGWVCDETERRLCRTGLARFRQLAWGWK